MNFLKNLSIIPRWIIVLFDSLFLIYSVVLGFFLIYNFEFVQLENKSVMLGGIWFLIAGLVSMKLTESYLGIVRHTNMNDVLIIGKMIGSQFFILSVVNIVSFYLLKKGWVLSFGVLIVSCGVGLYCLVLYRLIIKEIYGNLTISSLGISPIIIYGAGEAGVIAQHIFFNDHKEKKRVIAFLDDDIDKAGKNLSGVKIYFGLQSLAELVNKHQIVELIIAVQKLSTKRKREIIKACISLGVQVKIIPPVNEWSNGSLLYESLKEVKIEELLSRKTITINNSMVKDNICGKTVMVTGAAGSIGKELVHQIVKYLPKEIIMVDQAESALYDLQQDILLMNVNLKTVTWIADIRKRKSIFRIMSKYKPQIIYHAAAYKHVPMMEAFPEEAIKCNILGTKILADLAVIHHVEKFVMISTDKAVNPSNVMGASKRIAEMYVQALNDAMVNSGNKTKFITTRFGNVLGSNGSVIPVFKKQIERGGPVSVTHPDITRYFMTIPEACQLILEAGVMGSGGEVFVFDMGKPVKIKDLAKKMIKLSGTAVKRNIKIKYTGLRQGEKLYEELLNANEELIETHHPKIMVAKVPKVPFESIETQIDTFKTLLKDNSDEALVSHMKVIVPEYLSKVSRFSLLDNMRRIDIQSR